MKALFCIIGVLFLLSLFSWTNDSKSEKFKNKSDGNKSGLDNWTD